MWTILATVLGFVLGVESLYLAVHFNLIHLH